MSDTTNSTESTATSATANASSGLTTQAMPREFHYNGQKLPDPDPNLSPDRVKAFYAVQYPELATAAIEGPTVTDGVLKFTMTRSLGTKG